MSQNVIKPNRRMRRKHRGQPVAEPRIAIRREVVSAQGVANADKLRRDGQSLEHADFPRIRRNQELEWAWIEAHARVPESVKARTAAYYANKQQL